MTDSTRNLEPPSSSPSAGAEVSAHDGADPGSAAHDDGARGLDRDLARTRAELRAAREALGASNEELLAANEELERSNEALHATNEALSALNAQLALRSDDLEALSTRLASVLRCISSPLLVVDGEGRLVALSDAARRTLGIDEAAIGARLADVADHPALLRVRQELEAVLAGAEGRVRELAVGGRIFRAAVHPVVGPDGVRAGATLLADDVTEQRQRERDFVALAENAPDIVARYDRALRHVYVNRTLERFTGRPREAWIGKTNAELGLEGELVERVEDALRACFETGRRGRVEFAFDNGARRFVFEARLEPEADEAGAVQSVVLVSRDVSDNRALQAERAELERAVQRAHRMQALGTLAGGVAHEFNNLLMAIVGFTELLLADRRVTPDMREDLEEIAHASRRGRDLVRQILAFTRPATPAAVRSGVAEPVARLEGVLRRTLPRQIALRFDVPDDLPTVRAASDQIEQIVTHLVHNAKDAMPRGGTIRVTARTARLDDAGARAAGVEPGEFVHLAVADDGDGMEEEVRRRVFDPFFTTKEVGSGTGMGLSIVYGVLHGLGGGVTCTSAPGEGSTFDVFLPAVAPSPPAPAATHDAEEVRYVLAVDDETSIRRLYERLLPATELEVLVAPDGASGLELFERHRGAIGLVVLDLGMPNMAGLECLARIRVLDDRVPVLVATGYADDEDTAAARRAGADDVLPKPFDRATLLEKARAWLARGAERRRGA